MPAHRKNVYEHLPYLYEFQIFEDILFHTPHIYHSPSNHVRELHTPHQLACKHKWFYGQVVY